MADIKREHIDNEKVIGTLEKLIETCRDGQNGFRDAAEHIEDPDIRAFFNEQSLERAQFAGELENEAIRLGKRDVDRKGTATAAVHRRWIDLKAALGGGEASILAAVESGEDTAKKDYEEALNELLPEDIRVIIARQAEGIRTSHDHAKLLRDRRKAA
ncbi:MAG TPA: PA2169 family four-helix-bundle protein [Clostridia bacterium]|nr:PA2169 family four-helix-bundle protein [Clostridia bacterium]